MKMIKRVFAVILAVSLLLAGSLNALADGVMEVDDRYWPIEGDIYGPVWDVQPQDWFHDGVKVIREKGLMTIMYGIRQNIGFHPAYNVPRQDMAMILARMYKNMVNDDLVFEPTEPDEIYYDKSVQWVKSVQIMNGYDNGEFGVYDPITREDFMVTLYRFISTVDTSFATETDASVLEAFPDSGNVRDYSIEAMSWAVENGILSGFCDGDVKTLRPQGTVDRAQTAVILQRFLALYEDSIRENGDANLGIVSAQ